MTSIPEKKPSACRGSPPPPSEPAASVTSQPSAGKARQSARATCAEPPRGKKKSTETTRPPERRMGEPRRRRRYPPQTTLESPIAAHSLSGEALATPSRRPHSCGGKRLHCGKGSRSLRSWWESQAASGASEGERRYGHRRETLHAPLAREAAPQWWRSPPRLHHGPMKGRDVRRRGGRAWPAGGKGGGGAR